MAKDWRIIGRRYDGNAFLVVMGETRNECFQRLNYAMRSYSLRDLKRIGELWVEWFNADEWKVSTPISLANLKRRKRAKSSVNFRLVG